MKRNNYAILNDYQLDIQKVDSLEKLDRLIDEITTAVDEIYPSISCKSGCFSCCTGASFPTVYAREWQRIREYIKTLPEETRLAIKDKVEGMTERHEELIQFVNSIVQQTVSPDELKKNTGRLVEEFKNESCPLHINGKCSVYPVRPVKCRIFGYFSMVHNGQVQMLSCASDIGKMQAYISTQKTTQVALPFWGPFERKLISLGYDSSEPYNLSIIPLWLKNEIQSGNLSPL